MRHIIEFQCEWNGHDKITAIKALRRATNCTLKEGKNRVEHIEDRVDTWRMNPDQFGLLIAGNLDMESSTNFYITRVNVIAVDDGVVDFTVPSLDF